MRAIDDMDSGLRRLENDPDSVILAVHGMTRPIPGGLKGGYGVFVSGFAERLNRSGQLPYLSEQTAELAELLAALDAVKLVHTLIFTGQNISHVVIKTTSEYLVNGMADLVWIWAGREYNNSYGRPIPNGRPFKYLHEEVSMLEKTYGIRVSFCRVDKEFNEPAAALAREAVKRL
ncbi:hypothetical protein DL95DRAFT_386810 [Leptodontidium sp. 2 PMI_412]|nr:hypothetical protein DL95DRAFT_386810 [Leptodontidium sp. 2 PMI_412]